MRVLIVSQYFHPENFRINQLAIELRRRGHEIVILTGQPNYPSGRFFKGYSAISPWREQIDGMDVIRVPLFPRGRGRFWELALNYVSFVLSAILFGLPRLQGRFEVCVAWCSSPITSAIPAIAFRSMSRTPVAIWVQDLWPETFFAVTKSRTGTLKTLLSRLVCWIYRNVDQIWIQSPAYEASVLQHGGVKTQIEYVPNWAEDLYDRDSWNDIIAEQVPSNALVFAGNIGRAQGMENMLDAASITSQNSPSAHWIFVGDGSLRDWLSEEIKKRSLVGHVSLLPRRPAEEMPKLLKGAAAVLVSLENDPVYSQTIPSKIQSCLASGRPVLGALFGQAAQVIAEARCGLVCAPQDPSALAKSIKDFIDMPEEEREKLGENGHKHYKAHFTQEKVVAGIEALLERMRLS